MSIGSRSCVKTSAFSGARPVSVNLERDFSQAFLAYSYVWLSLPLQSLCLPGCVPWLESLLILLWGKEDSWPRRKLDLFFPPLKFSKCKNNFYVVLRHFFCFCFLQCEVLYAHNHILFLSPPNTRAHPGDSRLSQNVRRISRYSFGDAKKKKKKPTFPLIFDCALTSNHSKQ